MNLWNLTGKITLDDSDYKKSLTDAKKETEQFSSNIKDKIGIIATNAFVQLAQAVLGAANKIKQLTLDTINYADNFSDLSAQYDINTKSLQEFNYIAIQNGTTLDSLLSTMTMMYNKAKEDADVFTELGVSVRDTNGNMKSMDTLFWEVKSALDGVTNSGDKSALMLSVFGRNAMSVGEVLRKDTSELKELAQTANDLGIVMEEGVIQKASDFNDKMAELKLRAKSTFAELIAGVDGAEDKFDALVDDMLEMLDNAMPFFEQIGVHLGEALIKGFGSVVKGSLKGAWEFTQKVFGKGWIWGKNDNSSTQSEPVVSDTDIVDMNSYEVTERTSQTLEIKLTASGTSAMDEQNIKLIANELIPIIDKGMGGI